jgi:hypothetical protein
MIKNLVRGAVLLALPAALSGQTIVTSAPVAGYNPGAPVEGWYNTSFGPNATAATTGQYPRNGNGSLSLSFSGAGSAARWTYLLSAPTLLSGWGATSMDWRGSNDVNIALNVASCTNPLDGSTCSFWSMQGFTDGSSGADWSTRSFAEWRLRRQGPSGGWISNAVSCSLDNANISNGVFNSLGAWQGTTCFGANTTQLVYEVVVNLGSSSTDIPLQQAWVDNVQFAYGNTSTARAFNFETSTVPEPSTYALMGAGLLGLFVAQRRRRRV